MNDKKLILESLGKIMESLNNIITIISEGSEKPVSEETKQVSLEEVRTVLANLSRDGFTKEVKDILKAHGADKLSAIDPKEYESIIKDAGEVKNGK